MINNQKSVIKNINKYINKYINKKKIIFIFVLFILSLFLFSIPKVCAKTIYDNILKYDITIDTRNDATLDIRIDIKWKVLEDDGGVEPLTWVKIGVPNYHCDEIKALSNNIDDIYYD